MSNYFYASFNPKYPGKINKTMRTNVPNLSGWDLTLDPDNKVHRVCAKEGGRFWWFDFETGEVKRRELVAIVPENDRTEVGKLNRIEVVGVPQKLKEIPLVINRTDSVVLKRDKGSNRMDHLDLGWDQPTPVTISLHPSNISLRARPVLIYFETPAIGGPQ
jgi:hypothetical protein